MINTIAFPKLNISLTINRVAFSVFGKDIYWYGLIIALGFVLGTAYALWRAKKEGLGTEPIFDVILWGLLTCIICARIFYVIGDPSVLKGGFWKIIAVWEGGIGILGAIIGAVIVGLVYSRVKKIDTGLLFDVCAPALMIGQIVGRWGNFVNAEVYGGVTDSFLGMSINGHECVQPLFLYESVWMLAGLFAILIYQKYKRVNGEIFLLYIIWYGVGRASLETLRREEYILKIFGMPMSQITAITAAAAALAVLVYLYIKHARKPSGKDGSGDGSGE